MRSWLLLWLLVSQFLLLKSFSFIFRPEIHKSVEIARTNSKLPREITNARLFESNKRQDSFLSSIRMQTEQPTRWFQCIQKAIVGVSLFMAVSLVSVEPAHSEVKTNLIKKSSSKDGPVLILQPDLSLQISPSKSRGLTREERRLEEAVEFRDSLKSKLDKSTHDLASKNILLTAAKAEKRREQAEVAKLDQIIQLATKGGQSSEDRRSLAKALSRERKALFKSEVSINSYEHSVQLLDNQIKDLKARIADEEGIVKQRRKEVEDSIRRRSDESAKTKAKVDAVASKKRLDQKDSKGPRTKSNVGAGVLSLLSGLSYLNLLQTLKTVRKGSVFGDFFRSEAAVVLAASIASLLFVLVT